MLQTAIGNVEVAVGDMLEPWMRSDELSVTLLKAQTKVDPMSKTANDVRQEIRDAMNAARNHSDLLRLLMPIAFAPRDESAFTADGSHANQAKNP